MHETSLKKPSQTDWARIDQMTDDEIDTSDIPPLDDAFFAAAQFRMLKDASRTRKEVLQDVLFRLSCDKR